ncbi:hypothetical protein ABT247_00970 [Kitasatospora sp. NPDC001539]|uniref:hypothetical protein n=1 Tax=Kitasatospora sp. NPDC001539 TaxID=3154384 RepID=UPI00332B3791
MSSGDDNGEHNPFAPPPADAPDQPWQPRGGWPGQGPGGNGGQGGDDRPQLPPPWGQGPGDGRPGQRPPAPQPPRLDPTDPTHRRARNAALAGPFALLCLFAEFHWVALLVALLAIYWGVSALRTKRPTAGAGPTGATAAGAAASGAPAPNPLTRAPNPLTPAALAGILTGAMTVAMVGLMIGLGVYYQDYVTCVQDSLTTVGTENCDRYAPQWYVDFTGNAE